MTARTQALEAVAEAARSVRNQLLKMHGTDAARLCSELTRALDATPPTATEAPSDVPPYAALDRMHRDAFMDAYAANPEDVAGAVNAGYVAIDVAGYRRGLAAAHDIDIRNREARALLARVVKYCREDNATTARATRLARLVEQVDDYLRRTHDPNDILRAADRLEKMR